MKKTEIMVQVSEIISFIKERVKIDLSEASIRGLIELDKNQTQKIGNIIESSIESSFNKSVGQLENKL